jgi:hypothetical protein
VFLLPGTLWGASPTVAPPAGPCAVAGREPCSLDLHGPGAPKLSANCTVEPWSRYVQLVTPDGIVDSNRDGWFEAVVAIGLEPARGCGCVKFHIEFEEPFDHWTLDIGDSPTNDGYGGDAGTTPNEAEMQIDQKVLTVLTASRNRGRRGVESLLEWDVSMLAGHSADIEICDQFLAFEAPGVLAGNRPFRWKLQTPIEGLLYSFTPRPGAPHAMADGKSKDKGLYAGFNRVIYIPEPPRKFPRIGRGVRRVELALSP